MMRGNFVCAAGAVVRRLVGGAGLVALCAAPALSAAAKERPPFIPVERQYLDLPAGMQPLWPTFAANGTDIVFQNGADGGVWMIGVDGSGLKCITCDVPGWPKLRGGGFVHAFPDGKRLLMTDGVTTPADPPKSANGWVLECGTSIRSCTSPRLLPIDMSADRGPIPLFQRRTWHMSPDGTHIGWMEVRADGTMMVVARLEREADKYVAADPRAVNPIGPKSTDDDNADRWENLSQLYELKSFTPDGKAILAVGVPNNNVDVLRIELATGRTARLTAHTDWDEDSSLSPDQSLLVVNSWRGANRLDPLAWIPQIRGFVGLMTGAAIAPYYVSTWEGFQCDLSPWLLPARGDDGGRMMGQPVDIYGGTLTAANNLHGQRVWSPDSTLLILQERTRIRAIFSPNRIAIARLGRAPTRPVPVTPTKVGSWAVPAKLYQGPHASERKAVVRGRAGGQATITYTGRLGGGGAATSVVFDRFTDDGTTFVTGTMSGAATKQGEGERRGWSLRADVAVTGRHTGMLKMDLTIDNAAKPVPAMTGSLSAVYDGKVAPRLPDVGPCYDAQAKASPLRLDLKRSGNRVRASVTSDVYGDVRPVMNATIRFGAASVKTDARGQAMLPISRGETPEIVATAGDTFLAARATVPQGR
jgi:hypothetical protein